jgi:hypothetical protein
VRDWRALVEQQLAELALAPTEKGEVVAELAAHLEEVFDESRRRGLPEEEAMRRALSQVGDWRELRRKIFAARRGGQIMEKRIRQLWIPGFLTLTLSTFSLMALQSYGFQPRIVSSGSNAIFLYMPWMAALPFFGALGAYVSSRAGGSRGSVVLASVFPTLAVTFAFLFMFPFSLTMELIMRRPVDFSRVATVLLNDGISWILIPGAALLVGGLLVQFSLSTRPSSRQTAIG